MVTKQQIEKTTVHLLFSLFYSIFSDRNQVSLFSRKAYDKLITMTRKKSGCMYYIHTTRSITYLQQKNKRKKRISQFWKHKLATIKLNREEKEKKKRNNYIKENKQEHIKQVIVKGRGRRNNNISNFDLVQLRQLTL